MAENTHFVPVTKPEVGKSKLAGLKGLAMRGAVWTFGGYGSRQLLRFVNNWVLTRLLVPELFGVMAIVNTFILGINFFSDIGINFNIIQSKRGNDPTFLNTAWTVQVLRGLVLFVIATLIAWPVSQIYDEPLLAWAIPVAGLTAIFQGFNSTKKSTANRDLQMRELMMIELGSYVIGLVIMLSWAYVQPSIWALVIGGVSTSFVEMILTHLVLKGHNPRFQWDWESFHELFRFGRWIIISTALTFLTNQSDRLIIGKVVDLRFLGIFFIGAMFAKMVEDAIRQLGYKVLLPSFSTLERDNPEQLYKVLRQARIILVLLSWSAALFFIVFGQAFINFLYDSRYQEAGWMLQTLALGTLVGVLSITYDNVLVAKGKTWALATLSFIQFLIQITAMAVGARYGGPEGVIVGLACVGWLIYPFKAILLSRLKLWQPEVDIPVIGLGMLVATAFFYL